MAATLIAQSQTAFDSFHQQYLALQLAQTSPHSSLDVEYVAESCLRVVCGDLDAAQSLIPVVKSALLAERSDVEVMIETFGVLILDFEDINTLSEDDLAESNRLVINRSDIFDFALTAERLCVVKFLRLPPADSVIIRGLSYRGRHYKCKPMDPHDLGAHWCYRCGSIFCLVGGGCCERRNPSCRHCGQDSHISRVCPDKHRPDFTPSCKACKNARGERHTDHATWDAAKCRLTWHRQPSHPETSLGRKRKQMQTSTPRVIKHRPIANKPKPLTDAPASVSFTADAALAIAPATTSAASATAPATTSPTAPSLLQLTYSASTPTAIAQTQPYFQAAFAPSAPWCIPSTAACSVQFPTTPPSSLIPSDHSPSNYNFSTDSATRFSPITPTSGAGYETALTEWNEQDFAQFEKSVESWF